MRHVQLHHDPRDVAWLTLNRPEVSNAFDAELVTELAEAATRLQARPPRAVVLAGNGRNFSAGADIAWMRSMGDRSREDNLADARTTSAMFQTLDALPCPVIGRIHGYALGGGVGLVAVCDVAVAEDTAVFGFSEVRLGIAPAVISPFVVRKIGQSHARALFVTGERFNAGWAQRIGLAHKVVDGKDLNGTVDAVVANVLASGPAAVTIAKSLPEIASAPLDEAAETTAGIIAELRTSDEGQEGMAAFLEKRQPRWAARS
jgi:methylglutaconyl-CoA hydratase